MDSVKFRFLMIVSNFWSIVLKFICLVLFMVFTLNVNAGDCVNCTVKFVGCSSTYRGVEHCNVYFNEPITNRAGCAASSDNRMAFDITSHAGKGILSLALAAQISGSKVTAYGLKTCGILPPYETINLLYFGNV
jgi:hypothetical protein